MCLLTYWAHLMLAFLFQRQIMIHLTKSWTLRFELVKNCVQGFWNMLSSTSRVLRANFSLLKRCLWTVESRGEDLVLREDDRPELRYPHVWLRDNCQCPTCFHQATNSRVINIEQFDFDSRPVKASVSLTLKVYW